MKIMLKIKNIIQNTQKRNLHKYWSKFPIELYRSRYLTKNEKSVFLLGIIKRYLTPTSKILEIGCGAGRNLNYLFENDFTNLTGLELNKGAIRLLRETYPQLKGISVYYGAIEDIIQDLPDNSFDCVFTMSVLGHIPKKSEWVFSELVRITKKYLITIEDETSKHWWYFPRNYKKYFEILGMKQTEKVLPTLSNGFDHHTVARVFVKDFRGEQWD